KRIAFLCFFQHPAPTEISTLSLHDALPIFGQGARAQLQRVAERAERRRVRRSARHRHHDAKPDARGRGLPERGTGIDAGFDLPEDRKSTRLNSSHVEISYAVFCLKKKK